MKKHRALFVTDSISGGVGRVISLLSHQFLHNKCECLVMCLRESDKTTKNHINQSVSFSVLESQSLKVYQKLIKLMIKAWSSMLCRFCECIKQSNSDYGLVFKFFYLHYEHIIALRKFIKKQQIDTVIAFLNEPIFMATLSKNKNSRLIISERNDPQKFESTKTTMAFIRKMYPKADCMVFQSPDAMQWYSEHSNVKGRVIFNPIKPDLPERHTGERKRSIVNFCRISTQKNLNLLVESFAMFLHKHPDYELYIYGDAVGNGAEGYIESVKSKVQELHISDKVHILPAKSDIHNLVLDFAMFVSSSDYEGMSNSMLEAMAIGLPTICTDCPAGGARAIIKDHENGILVPVNNAEAMCKAMGEVAENPALAEKLSINGTKIKEELAVDKIVNQWMEIING